MANITFKGNPVHTSGELPQVGSRAKDFKLVRTDLSEASLSDYAGKRVVLNVFPSVDTPTCATSVRQFNKKATELANAVVLCVSADLPFALKRFCGTEGVGNVEAVSSFRSSFAKDYGLELVDSPLRGLCSRAVVILDERGQVLYTEQVAEIGREPNYDEAIRAVAAP